MDIFLMGYMGSGKSTVGPLLAGTIGYGFIDFDSYIEEAEGLSITEIFNQKGEIYFRKKEMEYLKELLEDRGNDRRVIALGGGTPCYGNNLQLLKESDAATIYLQVTVEALTSRLWSQKEQRPLIAAQNTIEALEEYIRKHLFERGYYYNQADRVIKTTDISAKNIVEEIVLKLF